MDDPDKLPILIFPEGTCINNTSVMQFKKGSFEVGSVVYPVAIKVFTSSSSFYMYHNFFFFPAFSTMHGLQMLSGIQVVIL